MFCNRAVICFPQAASEMRAMELKCGSDYLGQLLTDFLQIFGDVACCGNLWAAKSLSVIIPEVR